VATIRYAPLAREDLLAIKKYLGVDLASPQTAKSTVGRITKRIRSLASAPEIGTPLSAICAIDSDYRFLVCGKYLVFYRYENEAVLIIRVLYGGRDYLAVLFGDEFGSNPMNFYDKN
jgi:plasmid stabilization system protein ParE